jgi:hypothetical protein
MVEAGFVDAGPDSLDPKNYTWGMNALLSGADPKRLAAAKLMGNQAGFTDRLDYIFTKNGLKTLDAQVIGTKAKFGSDHAGVVAKIALTTQSDQISEPLPNHSPFPISFWQWVLILLILIITFIFWRRDNKGIQKRS